MSQFSFIVKIDIGGRAVSDAYRALGRQLDSIERFRSWRATDEAYGADGRPINKSMMHEIIDECE